MPPPGKFWISNLLRSFLVYSWGEIVKVGQPILLNLVVVFEAHRVKCDSVSGRRGFKAAGYPRKEPKIALSY